MGEGRFLNFRLFDVTRYCHSGQTLRQHFLFKNKIALDLTTTTYDVDGLSVNNESQGLGRK